MTSLLAAVLLAAVTIPASAQPPRHVDVIAVLEPGASGRQVAADHGVQRSYVYTAALHGFAGQISEGRLAALERDPRVRYVELDQPVSIAAVTPPTGIDRVDAEANPDIGIDGVDDVRVDVDVAVIDTGVDLDHPDVNIAGGVDCLNRSGGPPWARTYSCEAGGDDGNGHGTHVAGTIAALDDGPNVDGVDVVGVAPGARVWAVKVLDDQGSGSTGSVIAGIDWVMANAATIEVANMSLGGSGASPATDDALKASYEAGVAYAVAAGNSEKDVSDYWPAGSPWVLTVSALADFDGAPGGGGEPTCRTDVDDTFADFSNYGATPGQDVDVIGPGVCILSTYPGGGYADGYSGTSMASPHVAGAAALLASSGATAAEIVGSVSGGVDAPGIIQSSAGSEWDSGDDPDGVAEPLLNVNTVDNAGDPVYVPMLIAVDAEPANAAPTASFTSDCTELTCSFDASASTDSDGDVVSYTWDLGDGETAAGTSVEHTYAADGTYTVELTVADDDGAEDSTSQGVTVTAADGGDDPEPEPEPVHVHDLAGSSTNNGGTWTATATVFVHGPDGATAGETVTFSVTSSRGTVDTTRSCTTGTGGTCTAEVTGVAKKEPDVTFTVATLSSGSLDDSHVTSVTVAKP